MHPTLRVALYGFCKFEQRALSSCFRWGARPGLALEQVQDLGSAQLIVANAEHPGAIEDLVAAGRASDAVFIGERAPDAAAARLARPIDALQVLRELDALSARRGISAPALPDLLPLPCGTAKARPPSVGFLSVDVPVQPASADQASPPASGPRALLVDDSEVALRFLQSRLHRLGLDTDLADGSARALELLAQRSYGYVFMDVELGEGSALDGLGLCQQIKRQHRHVPGPAPVLVLVSAHHSELDRARGAFAGCDHYLAKPADDDALQQLVSRAAPGPAQRGARP